jgi:UDP-glucose 4-epimerase
MRGYTVGVFIPHLLSGKHKGGEVRRSLVTGGAGFIGSHLIEALLAAGDEVDVIDDLSTGSYQNIQHLKEHPKLRITIASILDPAVLGPLVQQSDVVFHLAAMVGVNRIIDSPVGTIETNILGSHSVLSLAARFNKKCLITSTSEVYGKSTNIPFRENDDSVYGPTTKSRWSYACSKAIDEFLALAYLQEKGLPVIIARLFNTVGPRQTGRYGMVLPRFARQALDGQQITVYGTGEQTRSFLEVSDAVRAIVALAAEPKAIGEVFNVGNTQEVSIKDLAQLVLNAAGAKSGIVFVPYDKAYQPGFEDMERRVPSIDKIKAAVGFTPQVQLQKIVSNVVDWMRASQTRA